MVGLWLGCALVAFAADGERSAVVDLKNPFGGERYAMAPRDRTARSSDLKDPFGGDPPPQPVPFRGRSALDLKDPFGPPGKPPVEPASGSGQGVLDPFADTDAPSEEPPVCEAPETTAAGVVIQRPRVRERGRACGREG